MSNSFEAGLAGARAERRVRVLIVDDSALVRRVLSDLLSVDLQIEVLGTAPDAYAAREKIKRLASCVLTLNVEMPKMDGLQFLRNLVRLHPMPVIMCSSLTEHGADVTLDALALGAVDFVTKPKIDLAHKLSEYGDELRAKVKYAAHARVQARQAPRSIAAPDLMVSQKLTADAVLPRAAAPRHFRTTDSIIAIGASTGGTEAIREVSSASRPMRPVS